LKLEIDFSELKKYLEERFNAIEREIQSVKDKVYLEEEELYTIKQVQEKLKVSRQTIHNAIKSGKLKKEKLEGKTVRISSLALKEYREGGKLKRRKRRSINEFF
jgi:excisionase family DNA binding protein